MNFVLINNNILKKTAKQQTILIKLRIKPLSIVGTRSIEYTLHYTACNGFGLLIKRFLECSCKYVSIKSVVCVGSGQQDRCVRGKQLWKGHIFFLSSGWGWEWGGGVIARHGILTLHNRSSSDQQIDVNCSVTTVFDRFVYNLQRKKWTGNKQSCLQ